MKWVDLLKEKSQHIQIVNSEFIKRFEPQVREFRESINHSVSTSFASEWLSKWLTVANEDLVLLEVISPRVQALHDQVQKKVGQEIHRSDWHCIAQQLIDQFATVTGDTQWLHVDAEKAKRDSPFKSTIAHGLLLLSLMPKLRAIECDKTYDSGRFIMNRGIDEVRFHAPVKPGQRIRLRAYLRRVTPAKRHLEIAEDIIIELEGSLRQVCTATVTSMICL